MSLLEFLQLLVGLVLRQRLPAPICSCGVPGKRLLSVDQFTEPNVRSGSFAGRHERRMTDAQNPAIEPPHCGHWWVTLYAGGCVKTPSTCLRFWALLR